MGDLKPPFEIYDSCNIADANGHVCTAENSEIAKAILAALNGHYEKPLSGSDN